MEDSALEFITHHAIFKDIVCSAEQLFVVLRSLQKAYKVETHIFLERLLVMEVDSLHALHRLVMNEDPQVYPRSVAEIGLRRFKSIAFRIHIDKALFGEYTRESYSLEWPW